MVWTCSVRELSKEQFVYFGLRSEKNGIAINIGMTEKNRYMGKIRSVI